MPFRRAPLFPGRNAVAIAVGMTSLALAQDRFGNS
jgi:hypothetical protein